MMSFDYRVSKIVAFSPCRWPKVTPQLNTGFTEFHCCFTVVSDMPKRTERRDFSQCKELVSPSKKRRENRATSQDEGEDLAGPSSAEDTVSSIL